MYRKYRYYLILPISIGGLVLHQLLVLNLGNIPLYRHFYKCLYIEMLKNLLVY